MLREFLGSFVNSETGHSEDRQPNLRYALGSVKRVKVLGFLVNSETRHRGELQPNLLEIFSILSFRRVNVNTTDATAGV